MSFQENRRFRVVAFLLGVGPVACADTTSSRDGVHVDAVSRLELVEEVRIGAFGDPDLGFSAIGPVHVTADGTILVAELQDGQIRVYDNQGQLMSRLGRQGDGPGEFRSIARLGAIGDTIWVSDVVHQRTTLFAWDGRLLGTVSGDVQVPVPMPRGSISLYPGELRPDGFFLSSFASPSVYPNLPDRTVFIPRLLFDASGVVVDTVDYLETEISRPAVEVRTSSGFLQSVGGDWPPADSAERSLAVGGDSVKTRWRVPTSPADGVFEVIRVSAGNDTIFRTRFRYDPRPVLPAYLDSLAAAYARAFPSDSARMHDAYRGVRKMPPYHPPISSQRAGDDGAVWIRPNDGTPPSNRWVILGANGGVRGAIELPPRAVIRFSRGEYLWVSELDEFDVPWLVRYRVLLN